MAFSKSDYSGYTFINHTMIASMCVMIYCFPPLLYLNILFYFFVFCLFCCCCLYIENNLVEWVPYTRVMLSLSCFKRPHVSLISPLYGPESGGTVITIQGQLLEEVLGVNIADQRCAIRLRLVDPRLSLQLTSISDIVSYVQ